MRPAWFTLFCFSTFLGIAAQQEISAQDFAQSVPMQTENRTAFANDNAIDPFFAGSLGFIPFVSGLYLGPDPAQGIVFTLIDVVLAAGAWNALHSNTGDPDNAPLFIFGMAANNAIDTYLSVRKSLHTQMLRITPVTYDRHGRVSSYVTIRF